MIDIEKIFEGNKNKFKRKLDLIYLNNMETTALPLGLGYIAASLESKDISYRFLNIVINKETKEKVIEWVKESKFDIVGVSCYAWNVIETLFLIKIIKKFCPSALIILGGIYSVLYKKFLGQHNVDIVIYGEGETTILNLMDCVSAGRDIATVNGIAFKKNNKIIKTKDAPIEHNLDNIPSPYLYDIFKTRVDSKVDFLFNRGCPFNCIYCSWGSSKTSGKFRKKSLSFAIKELKHLKSKGIKNIVVADGTFNFSEEFIKQLAYRLKKEKLFFNWYDVDLRADLLTEKQMALLKGMGVKEVGFGLESVNKKTQKIIKKGLDVSKFSSAVNLAKKYGMKVHIAMQVGLPGENEEDVQKTVDFVRTLKNDELGIFQTRIQPGTELYDNFEKYSSEYGLKKIKDDKLLFYAESNSLQNKKIKKIISKIQKEFSEVSTLNNIILGEKYFPHIIQKKKNGKFYLTFYLTDKCNNNCVVCNKKKRIKKSIEEHDLYNLNITKIILTGGEPTLEKMEHITTLIKWANYFFPFAKKEMNTNGRVFSYGDIADIYLNDLKIKNYVISLFGLNSKMHDSFTNVDGSFDQTIKGIKNLKKFGANINLKFVFDKKYKKEMVKPFPFIFSGIKKKVLFRDYY